MQAFLLEALKQVPILAAALIVGYYCLTYIKEQHKDNLRTKEQQIETLLGDRDQLRRANSELAKRIDELHEKVSSLREHIGELRGRKKGKGGRHD